MSMNVIYVNMLWRERGPKLLAAASSSASPSRASSSGECQTEYSKRLETDCQQRS